MEILPSQFTSVEGITAMSAILANVIVVLANKRKADLTPQQKVILGTASATVIFFLGIALSPNAYTGPNEAMGVLFGALIATLTAAGIPVYAETAGNKRRENATEAQVQAEAEAEAETTDVAEPTQKTVGVRRDMADKAPVWGVWSRK